MKKTCEILAAAVTVLIIGASTASAQDTPRAGITMSTGTAFGVFIPVGDAAAVRAQMGFQRSTTEYPEGLALYAEATNTLLTPSTAVLVYLKSWDATRLYVSPQYALTRTSSDVNDTSVNTHTVSAMLGAQHRLGNRFAVFAEAGLGWARAKNPTSTALASSHTTSITLGTRSSIGGILFF